MLAQERYYGTHATYTSDLLALNVLRDLRDPARADSVVVRVLFAGGGGWSGVAHHRDQRGGTCVVFIGQPGTLPMRPVTEAEGLYTTEEGRVVCDPATSSQEVRKR